VAARKAVAIERHREALAHFRSLDPYLDQLKAGDQAAVLNDWARTAYLLDDEECVDLADRAIAIWRVVGDPVALADALALGARAQRAYSHRDAAVAYTLESIELLEPTAPSMALAAALCDYARLEWSGHGSHGQASVIADRAIAMAEETGDELPIVRALNVKGGVDFDAGDRSGMSLLEESRSRAEAAGYRWEEVSALSSMATACGDVREVAPGIDFARRWQSAAARYEYALLEAEAHAVLAEFLLWQGQWTEAEDIAGEALGAAPRVSVTAWRVLGSIQSRMGRSEANGTLAHMWSLALESEAITILDPAAGAMAEHQWLTGASDPELENQLVEILNRSISAGTPWPSAAFAFWMWKLGLLPEVPSALSDFYRWIMAGEWTKAAEFWESRDVPYEHGLALMHGDDAARLQAVRIFDDLGAFAASGKVRRELAERGVKAPRGRSQATRDHVAGLTTRQAEVLDLVAEGLTNTEVADRLFVSHRTVENHVAAVLMKLDVSSRDAAVEVARERGLLAAAT
jgi:DNA-binding CsgD family transcriptional regulator/tetratricopeptide (TPR) repeat protein